MIPHIFLDVFPSCFICSSVKVLLAEHKKSGKLYAIKALKKADIVSRDEVDRCVSWRKTFQNSTSLSECEEHDVESQNNRQNMASH